MPRNAHHELRTTSSTAGCLAMTARLRPGAYAPDEGDSEASGDMSSNEQRRRGTRRATAGIALALATLGVATGACKGDPALSAADALSRARGEIEQRIQGRWRLVSFVPDEALSPMLQALLAFQFDRLTVEFDHGRLRAHSPGVDVDRAYRVERPAGDTFQLVVLDEQNIDYESSCEFDQTERLQFRSRSSTWQGHGVLERLFP